MLLTKEIKEERQQWRAAGVSCIDKLTLIILVVCQSKKILFWSFRVVTGFAFCHFSFFLVVAGWLVTGLPWFCNFGLLPS